MADIGTGKSSILESLLDVKRNIKPPNTDRHTKIIIFFLLTPFIIITPLLQLSRMPCRIPYYLT